MARLILDVEGGLTVARNSNKRIRVDLGRTGIGVVLTQRQAIRLANELVDATEHSTESRKHD
ncbi:hypothetical protein [Rhodococcus erythropolis]|uniref:hypothetical protein n=1 Tax=Rhodococcus erythropolis TaxID=1833 RepID=UPI002226E220|nr:hypothetical protein [Rhodococcus erythropolis]MCW2295887.1 hypothetical protein [Rhodococcus erythropolis]